jgi:hypothetical protein
MDLGPLYFSFTQLSSKKSHCNETKGWLWASALPKPKPQLHGAGEARCKVLPAASPLEMNRYIGLPLTLTVFTGICHWSA